MSLKIIGYTRDCRTDTPVIYAEILMNDYLNLVGTDFDRFEIQRKRVDPKKYTRLKDDIFKGALLPGITLAIDPGKVHKFEGALEKQDNAQLTAQLSEPSDIYILDGLQRSFIIKDLVNEGKSFKAEQKILLEIWFEKKIDHLIYRLIVLNSGQKPMSMKHQVELLFMTMKNEIESKIPGLEIYLEKDETLRSKAKKFSFDKIVNAYYGFLTKSPEIERENLVVKKMNEDNILSSEEDELNESFNHFVKYLSLYTELDGLLYKIYTSNPDLTIFKNWLSEENTIKAFFAAIGKFGSEPKRIERIDTSLQVLMDGINSGQNSVDPLSLAKFKEIKAGVDSGKVNVGFGTRKLIMDGFREFFMEEGGVSFEECWRSSAS